MAQYRLSVYVASRSENRSGLAMAAYRAAEKLVDQKTGETIDYSRKQGVLYSEIITPQDAPEWATDRAELWNRSEKTHKVQKAIVAREIQLSLPHELNDEQRREMTSNFARFMADSYGVAVDTNIHAPSKEGDERNYHAHLLICTRPFDPSKEHGLGNNVRDFDAISHQKAGTKNHVEIWRAEWERQINDALERADIRDADGVTVKVDHRSYQRQGKEQEPTIKEGTAATAKKRRGEPTDRAEQNEEIRQRNEVNARLAEEIRVEAQELDLLRRRQAELMAAHEIRATITPTNDPTEAMNAREAKDTLAAQWQELTASNDNAKPEAKTTDPPEPIQRQGQNITARQAERELSVDHENELPAKLPSESEQKYKARLQRWAEYDEEDRAKEQPKLELNLEPRGHAFGR